mgnify:CR=1 FL=1
MKIQFKPKLKILPAIQKKIWSKSHQIPKDFVLYGGTAIALQLGHRQSVDFDFFTSEDFNPDDLLRSLKFLANADVLQLEKNTLTVTLRAPAPVKISFFGGLDFGTLQVPLNLPNQVRMASLTDLFGHKLKTILQRVEAKDYRDIAALIESGLKLEIGLSAALGLFGKSFPPMECIKALTYFEGGDLQSLKSTERKILVQATRALPKSILPMKKISASI